MALSGTLHQVFFKSDNPKTRLYFYQSEGSVFSIDAKPKKFSEELQRQTIWYEQKKGHLHSLFFA